MSEVRITDPKTGGAKGSKPERYDLLPFDALDEVTRVYAFGEGKYPTGEDGIPNWQKGYRWSLSLAAMFRHGSRIMQGEDVDPESRCLHAAHIAWHALLLITYKLRGLGTDDRAATAAARARALPEHAGPNGTETQEPRHACGRPYGVAHLDCTVCYGA